MKETMLELGRSVSSHRSTKELVLCFGNLTRRSDPTHMEHIESQEVPFLKPKPRREGRREVTIDLFCTYIIPMIG